MIIIRKLLCWTSKRHWNLKRSEKIIHLKFMTESLNCSREREERKLASMRWMQLLWLTDTNRRSECLYHRIMTKVVWGGVLSPTYIHLLFLFLFFDCLAINVLLSAFHRWMAMGWLTHHIIIPARRGLCAIYSLNLKEADNSSNSALWLFQIGNVFSGSQPATFIVFSYCFT